MPKFNHIQHSFTAGELSPKMLCRTDLQAYRDGFADGQNMIVNKEGGVNKRPGTKFLRENWTASNISRLDRPNIQFSAGDSTPTGSPTSFDGKVRMIPFELDNSTRAVLIIGRQSNGETIAASCFDNGNEIPLISSYTLIGDSRISATPSINFYYHNRFLGYTDEDLDNLQFTQNGNIVFITCENQPPLRADFLFNQGGLTPDRVVVSTIEVSPDTTFPSTVNEREVGFHSLWPWEDYIGANDATAIGINVTHFALRDIYDITSLVPIFDTDITAVGNITLTPGQLVKLVFGSATATERDKVFLITSVINSTTAQGVLVEGNNVFNGVTNPGGGDVADDIAYEQWSHKADKKFPRSVGTFQQKTMYGGSFGYPETVWGTTTGDIRILDRQGLSEDTNFAPSSGDPVPDNPIEFTIASNSAEAASIQWFSTGKELNIGTIAREYNTTGITGLAANGTDAAAISVTAETAQGSVLLQARRDSNRLHFVDRSGQRLRRYTFDFNEDAFRSQEVSFNNREIVTKNTNVTITGIGVKPQYIDMHFQSGDDIMWMLTNFGKLIGWTLSSEFKVEAGHYHEIGGTDSYVRSICNAGTEMFLWVERTIDGSTKRYLEKLSDNFTVNTVEASTSSTSIDDKMVYCDSAKLQTLGSPGTIFNDFAHLEGETVDCVADGQYVGQKTVSSGTITLDDDATHLVAGLNYRAYIQSVPVENGAAIGSAQGSIKKLDRLYIRFYRSIGCKYGPALDDLKELEFRDPTQPLDDPIEVYTGDRRVDYHYDLGQDDDNSDRRGQYYLVQDLPLPCHIVGVVVRGITFDS